MHLSLKMLPRLVPRLPSVQSGVGIVNPEMPASMPASMAVFDFVQHQISLAQIIDVGKLMFGTRLASISRASPS